jgi:hypothetical protein
MTSQDITSAGVPAACEGQVPAGAPVPPGRAYILGRLEAEARQARGCFEWRRAAEIETQIRELSAGTPASPVRETTRRRPAASGRKR